MRPRAAVSFTCAHHTSTEHPSETDHIIPRNPGRPLTLFIKLSHHQRVHAIFSYSRRLRLLLHSLCPSAELTDRPPTTTPKFPQDLVVSTTQISTWSHLPHQQTQPSQAVPTSLPLQRPLLALPRTLLQPVPAEIPQQLARTAI